MHLPFDETFDVGQVGLLMESLYNHEQHRNIQEQRVFICYLGYILGYFRTY